MTREDEAVEKPRVKDLMSAVVETLEAGDSVAEAMRLMRASHVRHLPVIDGDERLLGLITEKHLLDHWLGRDGRAAGDAPSPGGEPMVEAIMEKDVVIIWPDAPALEAAELMRSRRIGCLPVVEDDKLVGIITKTDFFDYARRQLDDLERRSR
jgi:CBS domain-containing protein